MAKVRAKAKALPSNLKEALLDAMNVAETSIEAADYLVVQFGQLLTDANALNEYQDIMHKVEDFAKYTQFKLLSSSQPWLGQSAQSSDYKNMQANIAVDAVRNLKALNVGTEKEVIFDFAIDNQTSKFLRGCSAQGDALKSFDDLFNAWLIDKNLRSEGGTLYRTNTEGKIGLDAQGAQEKADPDQVKKLIHDPEQGFAKYMETKGVKVVCREQQYPTTEKSTQVQQTIKEAFKAAPEIQTKETEEPQTTMKTGL